MKEKLTEFITTRFVDCLLPQRDINTNLLYFSIQKEKLPEVVRTLKDHPEFAFSFLNDLTSIDWLGKREPRFEVIYLLRSPKLGHFRLQLRVPVGEGESVPSLSEIFPAANWPEREVFDLMGIPFSGHPRMERLIMPDNFVGHPLRKDYPLEGPGQDYLIEDLLTIHVKEDITG
ncbi:NADH-quinone oxidoreductase subunit C [Leptospira biflexa]|jgi:NADH-quinone oxidoreductase subunit C|uniref:NADH-quinone oxidoreductase subunit C n=1 Tax=Leptospira biflexa serovar Patoc (strain Patoc 1 / ATCC 23582 / Paris) TaxID=456481 RepID=B0SP84_LEPBP|nr:NADH-quinone oxidoreductase subunit C [Leptospira biflexa]ABZ93766.1 NADH dehydrogenase (ubiquinone), C chain [Leptospira biflexa serovar Patoc strain 'Patoc 1 (Ames)']ABZ97408.1 NADH-quinone oxidoreductase, chain C [Leptospira biflexa serovar Patoc strain 'Patoc 1 (Paris)']TGM34094.1 NADH-quinone oxidoreductase subunit C [Leptospira biflexa]TGM40248.1 NADH-quinone oxidoreductase subunit C [Leptospira biflexa]TGM48152.1 NADH-quinone oxidoreductase subunit C [Leptospira biflexa]